MEIPTGNRSRQACSGLRTPTPCSMPVTGLAHKKRPQGPQTKICKLSQLLPPTPHKPASAHQKQPRWVRQPVVERCRLVYTGAW